MAKVQKDGRLVLYYLRGKPVYADDNEGFYNPLSSNTTAPNSPDKEDSSKQDGAGFHNKNDHDKNRSHRDGDKGRTGDRNDNNKQSSSGKIASIKLVRGQNGRLQVQYVDTKTGKVLTNAQLQDYTVATKADDLNSINELRGIKPPEEKKTEDTGEDKSKTKDTTWSQRDGDFNDHAANGRQQDKSSTSSTSKGSPTGSNNNVEQGDTNDPDNTRVTDTGLSTAPDNSDRVKTTDQHPAYSDSLTDRSYVEGNLQSSYEGKNLNDVTVTGTPKDYTDAQVTDVAKTLAGEMDTRYSDPNSPEGFNEAAGIVSTMQNRDDTMDGDISAAIHSPKAYSTWNNDKVAANAEKNYAKNPSLWDGLAKNILSDPTVRQPYTNYYNPDLVTPAWSDNLLSKEKIGPHMFGIDPNMSVPQRSLTDEEKDKITTDQINNSFLNSTAYPGANDVINDPPNRYDVTDDIGNFPDAVTAQRDYTDPNQNTDLSGFAQAYGAQKYDPDYTNGSNPSVTDSGRFGSPNETGGNLADGINTQRDYVDQGPSVPDTSGFDYGRFGDYQAPDTSGFDYGRFGDYQAPDTSNFDSGRFGDVNTKGFDQGRFGPSLTQSPTGVYGDPTGGFGGFGDYVSTDKNAVANSGDVAASNESKVSGPTVNGRDYTPGGFVDASSNTDTSATSTSNTTNNSNNSTDSSSADNSASSDTSSSSSHDTSGTSGTDSTANSSGTSVGVSDTGGIFGGMFSGGDTNTNDTSSSNTSTSSTSTTSGTDTSGIGAGSNDASSDFGGGFTDGYL